MDQNLPIVTRKLWSMMKVILYMLRKNINKKKILLDLNLFIKRGKFVAEKTLTNLVFHHHHHHHGSTKFEDEYEFSCTNTPLYRQYLKTNKNNNHLDKTTSSLDDAVNNMWEMMILSSKPDKRESKTCRTPMSQKLRITDSPYPLPNEGGDMGVDEAADEFIKRFYSQLKQQAC